MAYSARSSGSRARGICERAWHHLPMPSPIGHMLAGAAAGLLVSGRRDASTVPAVVFALVAAAPDLDLVLGSGVHRGPSHSLTAAAIAGAAAWLLRAGRIGRVRFALAVAAAYATHTA